MHIWDLRTCTYSICGRAHMHIWDLRTCTYAICGLAHTRFAEVQLFPRGCHVATTWRTRCNHVETIALPQIAYVQVRKSQICICARPQIAYVQVRKSQMCMCASPPIEYVQVRKSQMCMCARPQIEYVQVRKSQMCMCARPQIAYVHVMTAATYRATVGYQPCFLVTVKEKGYFKTAVRGVMKRRKEQRKWT